MTRRESSIDRPLRVAVISDALHPWHKGGKETLYRELLERLPGNGCELVVYTMKWWSPSASPTIKGVTFRALCPKLSLYTQKGKRSVVQGVIFALATWRLLVMGEFDVILADQVPILQLFPLRVVTWIRRRKLAITWYEVWGQTYWQEYLGEYLGMVASRLESTAMRMANHVFVLTASASEQLQQSGVQCSKISTISCGANRRHMQTVTALEGVPPLVFVGRLLRHKRCDLAISAVAHLRARNLDAELLVVGVGPERARLEEYSQALGVGDLIRFNGPIADDDELLSTLKGARILVFPSEREGFGITVAEALALGTPVITTVHTSNEARLLVEHRVTGSLAPPGVADALADEIAWWLEHPSPKQRVSDAFWSEHPDADWEVGVREVAHALKGLRTVSRVRGNVFGERS